MALSRSSTMSSFWVARQSTTPAFSYARFKLLGKSIERVLIFFKKRPIIIIIIMLMLVLELMLVDSQLRDKKKTYLWKKVKTFQCQYRHLRRIVTSQGSWEKTFTTSSRWQTWSGRIRSHLQAGATRLWTTLEWRIWWRKWLSSQEDRIQWRVTVLEQLKWWADCQLYRTWPRYQSRKFWCIAVPDVVEQALW